MISTWTQGNIVATKIERPHDSPFIGNGIFLLTVSRTGPVTNVHNSQGR